MLLISISFVSLVCVRFAWVMYQIYRTRNMISPTIASPLAKEGNHCQTLVVLGSGGHTTEMLRLVETLDATKYDLIFVKAATDSTSAMRLAGTKQLESFTANKKCIMLNIPRSREVGQSYITSIATTLHAFLVAVLMVGRLRPDVIICNGPGTGLPICVAALLLRISGWKSSRIVFVESYCRVQTLSLTGKILYLVADVFILHWRELQRKYPRSLRIAAFVADIDASERPSSS